MLPLEGIRVLEFAGLAPGPFVGMVLGDHGASVTRIDQPGGTFKADVLCRSVQNALPGVISLLATQWKALSGHIAQESSRQASSAAHDCI